MSEKQTEKWTVVMSYEKDTRRTYRFQEVGTGKIGTLYVQKFAFTKQPKIINVTIDVVE